MLHSGDYFYFKIKLIFAKILYIWTMAKDWDIKIVYTISKYEMGLIVYKWLFIMFLFASDGR